MQPTSTEANGSGYHPSKPLLLYPAPIKQSMQCQSYVPTLLHHRQAESISVHLRTTPRRLCSHSQITDCCCRARLIQQTMRRGAVLATSTPIEQTNPDEGDRAAQQNMLLAVQQDIIGRELCPLALARQHMLLCSHRCVLILNVGGRIRTTDSKCIDHV